MKATCKELLEYKENLERCSISAVWYVTPPERFSEKDFNFNQRKEFFLHLLRMLLETGKIRLGKHGEFLQGSVDELISRYDAAFPKTEGEWETRGEHLWFYEDDCPGGIVWIHDSGYEDWT